MGAVGQNEIYLEVRLWLKKVKSYKLKAEDLSAVWWENVTGFSSPLPSLFFLVEDQLNITAVLKGKVSMTNC